jgi:serine protease
VRHAAALIVASALVAMVCVGSGARTPIPKKAQAHADFIPDDRGAAGLPGGWADLQWNFSGSEGVNAPQAWDNLIADGAPGGEGVTVAVLDTGAANDDPDLAAARFVPGYDFVDNDRYPVDLNGHGTHVASTIAEDTNNDIGVAGLAYGVQIMPVRVLDRNAAGSATTVADGIRYAVDHGAKVLNLSFSFDSRTTARQIPQVVQALDYAYDHGSLVVAAAGNGGRSFLPYPARWPNVLAVGATTEHGCKASFSNDGPGLDLVAPGGGSDARLSGDPNCEAGRRGRSIYQMTFRPPFLQRFGLRGIAGTSMAAPHVTAAAALVVASGVLGPDPSPASIVERLITTARDLGAPGYDTHYGWGLVDAGAATAQPPAPSASPNAPPAHAASLGRLKPNLIVRVHAPVDLRSRPGGPVVAHVLATTAFGSPETLSVTGEAGSWLEVTSELLRSGRPAWVDGGAPGISITRTELSILVRVHARTLELRAGGRTLRRFTIGVGAPASPTPVGRFAVTDKLRGARYGPAYGCCIIALTGHQLSLPPGWRGGDRIAIHGTNSPSTIGRARSAGCLHARDGDLRYLMARIPLGTPVVIRS